MPSRAPVTPARKRALLTELIDAFGGRWFAVRSDGTASAFGVMGGARVTCTRHELRKLSRESKLLRHGKGEDTCFAVSGDAYMAELANRTPKKESTDAS